MRRILPLRADRPLRHAADDLLGFDRMTEGLADQVLATRDGGLLAAVRAPLAGAGRSSFLNLLHEALLARGLPVLRLSGDFDPRLLRDAAPLRQGAPVILVDDANPVTCRGWDSEAILIVAWSIAGGEEGAELSPLTLDLPPWSGRAAASLARSLASGEPGSEQAWRALLSGASTVRQAFRLAQAAGAALASCGDASASEADVIASLAPPPDAATPPAEADATPPFLRMSKDAPADDETEPARSRCAELARQADAGAADELADLLLDERLAVRVAAIQAFAHLPASLGLAHVRPLLAHPDASNRRAAVHVLGRLGDRASLDDIAALVADPSADVRRAATAALGRLGGARAIGVLLSELDDRNAGLRMAAETAMGQLLDEIGADPSTDSLAGATGSDAEAEESPLRELVASLSTIVASRHESACSRALAALGRLGLGTAAEALAALLRSGEEREREAASSALLRAPGAVDALAPMLDDPDDEIARRAADLLGRLGDARAVPVLLRAHARASPSVRQAAAASLVRLGYGA